MGHLPFIKFKMLALLGIIPKNIANTKAPKYGACVYVSKTKQPWPTKERKANVIQTVMEQGQCVSVENSNDHFQGSYPNSRSDLPSSATELQKSFLTTPSVSAMYTYRVNSHQNRHQRGESFEAYSLKKE